MGLIVQKFGGTSVGSIDLIKGVVASRVIEAKNQGHDVVVVVSAISGTTDKLDSQAFQISSEPTPREYDVLVSSGEQVSMALLAMALNAQGFKSRSYTGAQADILTDSSFNKARILEINPSNLRAALDDGVIPIVAGFQGVDANNNITTLGRGGSDTTAVALAAALKADECQIFTDVDGVYTTDPRIVPRARRMDRITFEEMLELASLGAKVLQIRSVEFAGKYNVPLRVLSTFKPGPGTLITYEDKDMELPVVSGIAYNLNEAKLSVFGVPDIPGIAGQILGPISDANIEVDMIVQNMASQTLTDFSFTVGRKDYKQCYEVLTNVCESLGAEGFAGDTKIVKISLVGVGMRSHAGIASKMFRILGDEGINIKMITTSEIKVSVVVDEKYSELALRALHAAFELDSNPEEEKM